MKLVHPTKLLALAAFTVLSVPASFAAGRQTTAPTFINPESLSVLQSSSADGFKLEIHPTSTPGSASQPRMLFDWASVPMTTIGDFVTITFDAKTDVFLANPTPSGFFRFSLIDSLAGPLGAEHIGMIRSALNDGATTGGILERIDNDVTSAGQLINGGQSRGATQTTIPNGISFGESGSAAVVHSFVVTATRTAATELDFSVRWSNNLGPDSTTMINHFYETTGVIDTYYKINDGATQTSVIGSANQSPTDQWGGAPGAAATQFNAMAFGLFGDNQYAGNGVLEVTNFTVTPVPEPTTAVLLGMAGLAATMRRRRA